MLKLLKNLNLLLVEDDNEIRENLKASLSNFFNQVIEAKSGLEAIKIYKNHTIHLIITDYVMPIMSGVEFIKEVRKINSKIPIIAMSSYDDKEKLLSVIPLNLVEYLVKPITYSKLKEVLSIVAEKFIKCDLLKYDLSFNQYYDYISKELIVEDKIYQLTKQEVLFLELLMKNEYRVVLLEEIDNMVFGANMTKSALKNLIYRLRKKFNKNLITNVKDMGYILTSRENSNL